MSTQYNNMGYSTYNNDHQGYDTFSSYNNNYGYESQYYRNNNYNNNESKESCYDDYYCDEQLSNYGLTPTEADGSVVTELDLDFENEQRKNEEMSNKKGISTHYYWSSDIWTKSDNDPCSYIQTRSLLKSLLSPKMLVISPNSKSNIDLLSHYDELKNKKSQRTRRGMGHFRNYVYFSKMCTDSLKQLIDPKTTLIDPTRVFQFESRYFQYSLLQNKLTFIHTTQKHFNNNVNNIKQTNDGNVIGESSMKKTKTKTTKDNSNTDKKTVEYLIFRFWHSKNDGTPIYGIGRRTNDNIHKGRRHIYQPWECIDILEENSMINYFGLNNSSKKSQKYFLNLLPTPVDCMNKQHHISKDVEFEPNFDKIGSKLRRGYQRYTSSRNCHPRHWDPYHPASYNNNNHHHHRGGGSHSGIKNEPKFEFLEKVMRETNMSFDKLLIKMEESIINSYNFAVLHPEHVLTQAYIDEQNSQISYESVILAEIKGDNENSKTFYFGVPIVDVIDCENNKKPTCYYAGSILTPQMTIENIMLNIRSENFQQMKKESWISRMFGSKKSFYKMCENGEINDIDDEENDIIINKDNDFINDALVVPTNFNNNNKAAMAYHFNKPSYKQRWYKDDVWFPNRSRGHNRQFNM